MKRIVFMLWSTMLLMTSCSVDETYSCDPIVDDWVKANYAQLQDITRGEFLSLPNVDIQRATFRAVSQQKRIELWLHKIDELLDLPWTTAEKEHLDLLKVLVEANSSWFQDREDLSSKEIQYIDDNLELTMYAWADYAKNEFGWTNRMVNAMVCSFDRVPDLESLQYNLEETRSNITIDPGDEPPIVNYNCDCNQNRDECRSNTTCKESNCVGDNGLGCGYLGAQKCDGECKPYK